MLSKPVEGVTILIVTSEAALPQDIRPTTPICSRACESESATAPRSRAMSPTSCVPSNELCRTALEMTWAAMAVPGWVITKG